MSAGSIVTLTASVTAGSTAVQRGQVKFCEPTAAHCTDSHLLGTAHVRSGINQSFPVSSPLVSVYAAAYAFEVNVFLELPRGLIFQPVMQYYMNCGGSSQNAVVLGFHTRINF